MQSLLTRLLLVAAAVFASPSIGVSQGNYETGGPGEVIYSSCPITIPAGFVFAGPTIAFDGGGILASGVQLSPNLAFTTGDDFMGFPVGVSVDRVNNHVHIFWLTCHFVVRYVEPQEPE